jgi:hypothetical protein
VARLPARSRSRRRGPNAVPWQLVLATALRIGQEGQRRWHRLSKHERDEVAQLVRKSRGRLGGLSERERRDLRRLVWKALSPDG